MFARNPIRYTGGITQRFLDINFVGMDKDGCVALIERNDPDYFDFIAIAYECGVILHMYVDHFGNSNMQEWLDEHKDKDVGYIEEEDNHEKPLFFIKDNGIRVDMRENAGVCDSFEEDMGDNEDVYPRRVKKYALTLAEGTIAENYARIWSYSEDIRRSNPGSTVKICVDAMPDGMLTMEYSRLLGWCFV
ncbi:unnamed protein product [Lactuca saligna]|uniref:Uncharacterized protein n=1 Tax=Lactuca saligna TaxID=75948 RepID=A0AA36EMM0_LACSI|nr:unnamed protein product [Lactuca saligna]